MDKIEKTLELLRSGTVNIYSEDELIKAIKSGKKLKVKLGADPTAADLHLGHMVVFSKLKAVNGPNVRAHLRRRLPFARARSSGAAPGSAARLVFGRTALVL